MPEESEDEISEEEEIEFQDSDEIDEDLEELEETELTTSEIIGAPQIMCAEDEKVMDLEGTEVRDIEKRKFLFKKETESHMHLQYKCPECGREFYHDTERQRQGCFIATAAYGTPFSREIDVLRKFRDSYLVHKVWGKKLVSLYYKTSPPIANVIKKSENMKKVVRKTLKPIVKFFKKKYNSN